MSNSPKIYFIEKDGSFYNSRDGVWYSTFVLANYERSKKVLESILDFDKFKGCSIYETTEEHFMNEMATATTDLVISGAYFCQLLEQYAYRLPTISQVNKTMYQKCKSAIDVLKPFSSMHKEFLKAKEDLTDDVTGHYAEYISNISKTKIYQMGEVNSVLNAYQSNRDSIVGIAKKVLR
jgi:hypothetical protein